MSPPLKTPAAPSWWWMASPSFELDVLDTAGGEEHQGLTPGGPALGGGHYGDGNIFRDQLWRVTDTDHIPLVLEANKTDQADFPVTPVLGQEAAEAFRVPFMDTSSRARQGVAHAFCELAQEIRRTHVQELMRLPHPVQNQGCGFRRCKIL